MDADTPVYFGEDEIDIASEVEFVDSDGESDRMTTTSDEHGSTMDVADYDFQWVNQPDVTEEMFDKLDQVPMAQVEKRNPISLQSLCVIKILSTKLAEHHELTQEFKDVNGNPLDNVDEIKKIMEAFADPECEKDHDNLYECCRIVSPVVDNWFPRCDREFEMLRELGNFMALASVNDPAAELLARNAYSAFMNQLPEDHEYAPTFESMRGLGVALGVSINKGKNQLVKILSDILTSSEDQDRAIRNHTRAFMKKYLPDDFIDGFIESGYY